MTTYSWRNHPDHRTEARAVKEALIKAGLPVLSVGHGPGTAWAWLKIKLEPIPGPYNGYRETDRNRQAITIAKALTGRTGEYDGDINCS